MIYIGPRPVLKVWSLTLGLSRPMYFTEGTYEMQCIFDQQYASPGNYDIYINMVNYARRSTSYTPDIQAWHI